MEPIHIGTMSLNQLVVRLRALGMRTSEERVGAAIEQGLYPFAICIHNGGNRMFEIYTKLFEQWALERATEIGEAV